MYPKWPHKNIYSLIYEKLFPIFIKKWRWNSLIINSIHSQILAIFHLFLIVISILVIHVKGLKSDLLSMQSLKVFIFLQWSRFALILSFVSRRQGVSQIFNTEVPDFSLTLFQFAYTLNKHFYFATGIYPLKTRNI